MALRCGRNRHRRFQRPSIHHRALSTLRASRSGALAPNTIGTFYGRDLAFTTRSLGPDDLYNGTLPTTLLGSGVRLLINRTLAYIYFVSPGQVNFLVPSTLTPGRAEIQLGVDGRYGEAVQVTLTEFSPALFQLDPETALATRVDGTVVSGDKPARPGDVVILYATGLGATRPRIPAGQIPVRRGLARQNKRFSGRDRWSSGGSDEYSVCRRCAWFCGSVPDQSAFAVANWGVILSFGSASEMS